MKQIVMKSGVVALVVFMIISSVVVATAASKPGKVGWKSISKKSSKVVLKWKKSKNAKKYEIWSRKGNAKWKKVKTLKKRSYTYKISKNIMYRIKIRGVNGSAKGKFSKIKKVVIGKVYKDPVVGSTIVFDPTRGKGPEEKIKVTDSSEAITYGITSDNLNYECVDNGAGYTIGIGDSVTSYYSIEPCPAIGVGYNVHIKSPKYKIYWSCDGVEPVVGQEEVIKKLPMYRFAKPVRGTVTSADGSIDLPKIKSSEFIEEAYYTAFTSSIWIKVYKNNTRVCEVFEIVKR